MTLLMGDGVLAYFGWPQAHEDDAERAVRVGLAPVQTVGALEVAGRRLAAPIGIATGLVVVGEFCGEGEAQERAVEMARRRTLPPGCRRWPRPAASCISQATRLRRAVCSSSNRPRSDPRLKGFAEPVAACRVVVGRRLSRWPLRGPPRASRGRR